MSRRFADWGGNVVSLVIVIVVNALADKLPIAGTTTGQVADKYASMFTPAGFAFSIWGPIYLGLTAFVIYQALPAQRSNGKMTWFSLSWLRGQPSGSWLDSLSRPPYQGQERQ